MNAKSSKQSEPAYGRGSGVRRIALSSVAPQARVGEAELGNTAATSYAGAVPRLLLTLGAQSATLLLSCPSSPDVTAAFGSALAFAGARVLHSEQCTHPESGYLFQRVHADTSALPGGAEALERLLRELARQRGLGVEVQRCEKKRIAIFVSKYDHCLYDLLLREQAGELGCKIALVVSNHPDLGRVAAQFGVDFEVSAKNAANKARAEERECALLEDGKIDLVVMARYMQVLSTDFVARWRGRVINIHHSFLPAFMGAKPYHQAQERGVKLIGATAHYATANLDEGPIIEQDVVRCSHKDTTLDLITKGRDLERQVLARAVRYHVEDRVIVHGNRTVVFD
jgi:formyltetrahydrofolate deformylase